MTLIDHVIIITKVMCNEMILLVCSTLAVTLEEKNFFGMLLILKNL